MKVLAFLLVAFNLLLNSSLANGQDASVTNEITSDEIPTNTGGVAVTSEDLSVTSENTDGSVAKEDIFSEEVSEEVVKSDNSGETSEAGSLEDEDLSVTEEAVTEEDDDRAVTLEEDDDRAVTLEEDDDLVTQEALTKEDDDGSVTQEALTKEDDDGSVTQEALTKEDDDVSVTKEAVTQEDDDRAEPLDDVSLTKEDTNVRARIPAVLKVFDIPQLQILKHRHQMCVYYKGKKNCIDGKVASDEKLEDLIRHVNEIESRTTKRKAKNNKRSKPVEKKLKGQLKQNHKKAKWFSINRQVQADTNKKLKGKKSGKKNKKASRQRNSQTVNNKYTKKQMDSVKGRTQKKAISLNNKGVKKQKN